MADWKENIDSLIPATFPPTTSFIYDGDSLDDLKYDRTKHIKSEEDLIQALADNKRELLLILLSAKFPVPKCYQALQKAAFSHYRDNTTCLKEFLDWLDTIINFNSSFK